jgi:hypothetical protein
MADPDPGSGTFFTPGSGMDKFGSGVRDKHPGSATLVIVLVRLILPYYRTA